MTGLRWKLADDNPQSALFAEEELVDRHVGIGEYRGLEFLHVNAQRVINEVPAASRMPFRYTINAYRGCSHACVYCMDGETEILMADGGVEALAAVRPGDEVCGTVTVGSTRHYTRTSVLAHWETVKPAFRVSLDDGTELVASGDHRFLTAHGWKYVHGSGHGSPRSHRLSAEDSLIGPGCHVGATRAGMAPHWEIPGAAMKGDERVGVVAVEALGIEMPMFDITTGTGDFIANGVVSHNCFARPTHEYLGLNIGSDFDSKIVVKVNAVERVRAELRSPKWTGEHIAMGTNTDPYQRCEGKYHLTQGIIRALAEARNPFSILTKSTLILRDLDLLAAAARRTEVRCNLSIGTLDEEVWKLTEPGTPHPKRRVEAVRRLNEAGVACGVLVAPLLPGMSDGPDQVDAVVKACVNAGAVSVSPIALHLRKGVKDHFMEWLRTARPDLVPEYERRYRRDYLPPSEQDAIGEIVRTSAASARGRAVSPSKTRSKSPAVKSKVATPAPGPAPAPPAAEQLPLL